MIYFKLQRNKKNEIIRPVSILHPICLNPQTRTAKSLIVYKIITGILAATGRALQFVSAWKTKNQDDSKLLTESVAKL